MKDLMKIIFGATVFLILMLTVTCSVYHDITDCDTVVVLKNGDEYKCKDTYTHNGMTHMKTCNDHRVSVPANSVKIIIQ